MSFVSNGVKFKLYHCSKRFNFSNAYPARISFERPIQYITIPLPYSNVNNYWYLEYCLGFESGIFFFTYYLQFFNVE
jgi:hypothetical protein